MYLPKHERHQLHRKHQLLPTNQRHLPMYACMQAQSWNRRNQMSSWFGMQERLRRRPGIIFLRKSELYDLE